MDEFPGNPDRKDCRRGELVRAAKFTALTLWQCVFLGAMAAVFFWPPGWPFWQRMLAGITFAFIAVIPGEWWFFKWRREKRRAERATR